MGNKLRDMVENKDNGLTLTLRFNSHADREKFAKMVNQIKQTDIPQETPIPISIEVTKTVGDNKYPVNEYSHIKQMKIGSEVDITSIPIQIDGSEDEYIFRKTVSDNVIHFVSLSDKVIKVTMDYFGDTHQINFQYSSFPEKADTMEELIGEYKKFSALLKTLFSFENNSENEKIEDAKKYFAHSIKSYIRSKELGEVLGIEVTPKELLKEENEGYFVEEFYLLLVKKAIIRRDDKLKHIEMAEVSNTDIGKKILATYIQEGTLGIYGESKKVYTVNCIFNAEVCEVKEMDDGKKTVYFKDTETDPMYRSYSAFLNKEGAEEEMEHIELKAYEDAKSFVAQMQEIL